MATIRPEGISWWTWGADALSFAQSSDRPILLSINAVWCYWCHVMDDSTYIDPDVAQFVNENFVPVRVDTDHRPDVNARYNVGGWPTTSFLTPHGGYIAGATYLPPDQFLAMLDEVRRAYSETKPDLYEQANDILRQRREHAARVSAGREPDAGIVDAIARRIAGTYDPIYGGFGIEPKFPSAGVLRLLLHRYRTTREPFFRIMLEKSLDAITGGPIADDVDGGFFRFAAAADWSEPQHEKMAEDNIALASVLMDASIILERPDYGSAASRAIDYVLGTLYDASSCRIRGSQGAHSDYFGLSAINRSRMEPPPADRFTYTSLTGQAVSLLFAGSWKLGRPELADTARAMLAKLVDAASSQRLAHVFDDCSAVAQGEGDFLTDWTYFLLAAVDGYDQSSGDSDWYLESAEMAAAVLLERFIDGSRGGFFDVEDAPGLLGYLRAREKPLQDNAAVAEGLIRLNHITNQEHYRQTAHHVLSAYVDAHRDYGEWGADYAVALDHYLNPMVEVTVEGQPGSPEARAMLSATMMLDAPNLVIKMVVSQDKHAPAQAHVCLDTVCYPPVSDPSALAESITSGGAAIESPFQNVLDLLL